MPGWDMAEDGRLFAPATMRNRDAILDVLTDWAAQDTHILEIASGTGEHAIFLSRHLTNVSWQPTDPESRHVRSIAAWTAFDAEQAGRKSPSPLPPLVLDVTAHPWPFDAKVDGILCCNLTHIAPWSVTKALMAGASSILAEGGALWLYGPFLRDGKPTSEGDARFDASLRAEDPSLGLRDLEDVHAAALVEGLKPADIRQMPANNLFIRYTKAS